MTQVKASDNTSVVPFSSLLSPKEKEEDKSTVYTPSFSDLVENVGKGASKDVKQWGESKIIDTDVTTGEYFVTDTSLIEPLISVKEDPLIKSILSDNKSEQYKDLNTNLTGYTIMTPAGQKSQVLSFPENVKTLDEKLLFIDQNDGRELFFDNKTDRTDPNSFHTIDFTSIMESFYATKRGDIDPTITPQLRSKMTNNMPDANPDDIVAVYPRVKGMVDYARSIGIDDPKLLAGLAKSQYSGEQFWTYKVGGGAYQGIQFIGQALTFAMGETLDRISTEPVTFLGHSIDTGEGRGALQARFMPTLADQFRKSMMARGLIFSEEESEKIMSYAPGVFDRGVKLTTETVPISLPMMMTGLVLRAKEGAKFMKWFNTRKSSYDSIEEAAEAYVRGRATEGSLFSKVSDRLAFGFFGEGRRLNVHRDRIVGSIQIWESSLPAAQRSIVRKKIEWLDKLMTKRDGPLKPANMKLSEWKKDPRSKVISEKPAGMSMDDWVNTPKYKDLSRQIRNANMDLWYTKAYSSIPNYTREVIKPEVNIVLFASAAGQIAQQMGEDPSTGELIGIALGIGDGLIPKNLNPRLLAGKGLENLGTVTLRFLERISAKGEGSLVKPRSKTVDPKIADQIEQMAGDFNKLAPDVREQVLERVEVFFQSRDALIKAGVKPEVLNASIAKITGLAMLNVVETQIKSQVAHVSSALDLKMTGEFQELVEAKTRLNEELGNLAASLVPQTQGASGKVVAEFLSKMRVGIAKNKKEIDDLNESISTVSLFLRDNQIEQLGDKDVMDNALSESIEHIYDLTGLSIAKDSPDIKGILNSIDETSSFINAELQRKIQEVRSKATNSSEFKSVDKWLSVLAENRRITLERKVKAGFKDLDKKYKNQDISADGTSLFKDVLEYVTDPKKPAATLNSDVISEKDASSLLRVFDNASKRILDNYFQGDEDAYRMLLESMPKGSQKSPAFVLDFLRKSANLEIPVRISAEEVFDLTQGLKRKANSLSLPGLGASPASIKYGNFADNAELLLDNFQKLDPTTNKYINIEGNVREEYRIVRSIYKEDYADKVLKKGSFGEVNLGYTGKELVTDPDDVTKVKGKAVSQENPSGKVWKNKPENWISIDRLTKNDNEATWFAEREANFYGEKKATGKLVTVVEGGEPKPEFKHVLFPNKNKGLKEIYKTKTIQWISEQLEKGEAIDSIGMQTKLKRLKVAFNNIYDPMREFDVGGYFGTTQLARRNRQYKTSFDTGMKQTDYLVNKALKPAKEYVRQLDTDTKVLIAIAGDATKGDIRTTQDIFNYFMAAGADASLDGKGASRIDDLRKIVVQKGAMKADAFDNALRHIVGQHINDAVFKDTGKVEFFGYLQKPTKGARSGKAGERGKLSAKIFETDFKALEEILVGNEQRTAALKNVLGEAHFEKLKNIARYMSLQQDEMISAGITGVPRGLSIESWISRVYAINRNVVSKRYVATEAAIQSMRMKNFSLLQEIISDPEAGKLFGDLILTGKPLDDEGATRLINAMVNSTARADARTRGATTKSLFEYGKTAAQMAALGITTGVPKAWEGFKSFTWGGGDIEGIEVVE